MDKSYNINDEHIPQQDNTYAYNIGRSDPFTVVCLDIGTQERKTAVTDALNNIINNNNPSSQPYRNLLEHVQNGEVFLHASQGHLICLKHALKNADTGKELCAELLESIRSAEKNPSPEIVIKGFSCRLVDEWVERGRSFFIGQYDAFYCAAVSDGTTFEYDFKPDREKVMSEYEDKMAEKYMDHYEAEHGADGYAMFPDTKARAEHIPQQQDISHNIADLSAKRGERQNTMENQKPTEQGETQDKAAEPTVQQETNGWDDLYDYGLSNGHNPFGPDDNAYPYGLNNNADPSAKRGERQNIMANKNERSTKIEVTAMTIVESEKNPNLKALATVALNDEFVLKGIKVVAKKDNAKDVNSKTDNSEKSDKDAFFVSMPSRVVNGEYADVFFPITAQAYEQLNNAVIDSLLTLVEKGEPELYDPVNTPEKSVSDISVSLHKVDGEHTKAAGQIVIDDSFVVTGVMVVEGINKNGVSKTFVQMPSYRNQVDDRSNYANPITSEMHNKIQSKVLNSYRCIPEYRGVKFGELGDKENVVQYTKLNNSFANRLMEALDAADIDYNAKIIDTTTISIKSENKESVDKFRDDISEALKNEREATKLEKKTSITEQLTQTKKIADKHNERKPGKVKKHKEQEL